MSVEFTEIRCIFELNLFALTLSAAIETHVITKENISLFLCVQYSDERAFGCGGLPFDAKKSIPSPCCSEHPHTAAPCRSVKAAGEARGEADMKRERMLNE